MICINYSHHTLKVSSAGFYSSLNTAVHIGWLVPWPAEMIITLPGCKDKGKEDTLTYSLWTPHLLPGNKSHPCHSRAVWENTREEKRNHTWPVLPETKEMPCQSKSEYFWERSYQPEKGNGDEALRMCLGFSQGHLELLLSATFPSACSSGWSIALEGSREQERRAM